MPTFKFLPSVFSSFVYTLYLIYPMFDLDSTTFPTHIPYYFIPLVFLFIHNNPCIHCCENYRRLLVGSSILVPGYHMLTGIFMTPPYPNFPVCARLYNILLLEEVLTGLITYFGRFATNVHIKTSK